MSMDSNAVGCFVNALGQMVTALATAENRDPKLTITLEARTWGHLKIACWERWEKRAMPWGPNVVLVPQDDPRCDHAPGFWLMGQWIRRGQMTATVAPTGSGDIITDPPVGGEGLDRSSI